MATHCSAIAFVHKLQGMDDPTDNFLIVKALQGAKNGNPHVDTRLPITLPILLRLVDSLDHLSTSRWNRNLYRSMYLLAFFALLRVGEMTVSSGYSRNTLTVDCMETITGCRNLRLQFHNYKHSKRAASITIEWQAAPRYCPVRAWQEYHTLRGSRPGFLFLRGDGKPPSRRDFAGQLALSLQACQLSPDLYKTHSFRIGAATYAAGNHCSPLQIRALGRWNSLAFLKYLRL